MLLFCMIGLLSCVPDSQFTAVDPYYVFHDDNSKMWQVNHLYKDGKDYAPVSRKYKEIITFYKSGNCYIQRMYTFGDERGKKASFTVNGENKSVSFFFSPENWEFKWSLLSEDKIILEPQENTTPYRMELIPVTEP